jgi:hypothetical protein
LDDKDVISIFVQLGIDNPNDSLVKLGENLLNLALMAEIISLYPNFNLDQLKDEANLWEKYIEVLRTREGVGSFSEGEMLIAEAIKLAKESLNQQDKTVRVKYPFSVFCRRLSSWGIIVCDGNVCHFYHEKLQYYFCAWDFARDQKMPYEVMQELQFPFRARNVILYMKEIYSRGTNRDVYKRFLKEAWNVQ